VQQVRHGIAYLAVRSGAPVVPVACHGTPARRGLAYLRRHRPPILVAFGDPLQLPAGPAARRTVAAAADEIHRTLAAHVAATRPAPTEPERDQP
jgi:1-acyl-sn-glycerol-3-phosphate acyltransferase